MLLKHLNLKQILTTTRNATNLPFIKQLGVGKQQVFEHFHFENPGETRISLLFSFFFFFNFQIIHRGKKIMYKNMGWGNILKLLLFPK